MSCFLSYRDFLDRNYSARTASQRVAHRQRRKSPPLQASPLISASLPIAAERTLGFHVDMDRD
jgi:hypothetical protein